MKNRRVLSKDAKGHAELHSNKPTTNFIIWLILLTLYILFINVSVFFYLTCRLTNLCFSVRGVIFLYLLRITATTLQRNLRCVVDLLKVNFQQLLGFVSHSPLMDRVMGLGKA